MAKIPELIIGYEGDLFPVPAVCSACGKEMPIGDPHSAKAEDDLKWFKAHFDLHVRQKHWRMSVLPTNADSSRKGVKGHGQ